MKQLSLALLFISYHSHLYCSWLSFYIKLGKEIFCVSLRAISNFNEFLGLLISSLNNLYVLFLPQHWDMEGRERHDCVAYLSISRYWLDVERNKKEKFACVCKKKIIHHHWWLSMLTHMLLHVCVYLWVVDIYTNLYVLYTYGSLCIFIYIF